MLNSRADNIIDIRYPWLFGKTCDLTFLYASILLGFAMFFLSKSSLAQVSPFWAIVATNAFGAGPFHQGATWFAYLDKENRQHYQSTTSRQIIFFLAPVFIFVLTVVGMFCARPLTAFIWMAWSLQHLVQQNIGILLLYHRHGQGEAIIPRPLEARSQQVAAVMFSLIFLYRSILEYKLSMIMIPLIVVVAIYTASLTWRYIWNLRNQLNQGAYLNLPALMFWCFSMLCLWPMAFIGHSFYDGYIIPITVHWFQYILINYVLVNNKYSTDRIANLPVSHPITLFFLFCAGIMLFVLSLSLAKDIGIFNQAWQQTLLIGAIFGLGNVHYFLDAFLWRFREPYQRQAILPYLLVGR